MSSRPKSFNQRCYDLLMKIPRGKVTTYAEIARALNCKAYRAVGNAMNSNPDAPRVPCHRVVKSGGTLGGYALGSARKEKILREEGVPIAQGKILDFESYLYRFKA